MAFYAAGGGRLKQQINESLKKDRAAQTKRAGEEAKEALSAGDIREAFRFLQGWYRDVTKVAPKPCFQTVERQTHDRKHLYPYVPSLGDPIPVNVDPCDIEEGRPQDPEIRKRVRGLPNNRAGGAAQIQADDLKCWLTQCEAEEC